MRVRVMDAGWLYTQLEPHESHVHITEDPEMVLLHDKVGLMPAVVVEGHNLFQVVLF